MGDRYELSIKTTVVLLKIYLERISRLPFIRAMESCKVQVNLLRNTIFFKLEKVTAAWGHKLTLPVIVWLLRNSV